MKRVNVMVALAVEKARLEAQAAQNARAVERALHDLYVATAKHGDGSDEQREVEVKADALFDRGEEIAARLVEIEAQLGPEAIAA